MATIGCYIQVHNVDEFSLIIVDRKIRHEVIMMTWEKLCSITKGWIGGHGQPERLWKLKVASLFWKLEQAVFNRCEFYDDCKVLLKMPLTKEEAKKIDNDFVSIFQEQEEDDDGVVKNG